MQNTNPQAVQMADPSMLRTLAAQAEAIWPREQVLFERYGQPKKIADIGCGSGEITSRLAQLYPNAEIVGVDILDSTVEYARRKHAKFENVRFQQGDVFDLPFPENEFDLVVCRHMTQAIPNPEKAVGRLAHICRKGGWLHVLSEDYRMLHFPKREMDPDILWYEALRSFCSELGINELVGRRTWGYFKRLGFADLEVNFVNVDTLRVSRKTFAAIIEAWRDGYVDGIQKAAPKYSKAEIKGFFDAAIDAILDENEYSVWQVPIVSGRKPS